MIVRDPTIKFPMKVSSKKQWNKLAPKLKALGYQWIGPSDKDLIKCDIFNIHPEGFKLMISAFGNKELAVG